MAAEAVLYHVSTFPSPPRFPVPNVNMSSDCANYGSVNGSSCACPVGFGGATCSQPACGGNIFQGTSRSLTPLSNGANGTSFANITAAGCSCQDGWTGTSCNVCQTSQACQSGFSSVSQVSAGSLPFGASPTPDGQNSTLVCNNAPRVYAAGEMSCQVNVRSFALHVISCQTHFAPCRTLR